LSRAKKWLVSTLAVLMAALASVAIFAQPAQSAGIPIPGTNCIFSVQYPPNPDTTTMFFSYSNMLFQTPIVRAGACGHVMVQSLGVAAGPPCFIARIRTYNDDRTPNYDGPYMRWDRVGQIQDIRNGFISNGRLYRLFAVPCDTRLRNPSHPPGMNVYTHAG